MVRDLRRGLIAVAAMGFGLGQLIGVTPVVAEAASPHAAAVCGAAVAGMTRCNSWVVLPAKPGPAATSPSGYAPSDLRGYYGLTSASLDNGCGQTIGIVDAFDAPNIVADLAYYRSYYGLTHSSSCPDGGTFRKVDQNGGTNYPRVNRGWALEESLDVEMVAALCPNCNILLVEAKTNSFTNLGLAVNRTAALGATVISNSYGGGEFSRETEFDTSYYNHPGIPITASSGDNGYGVEYPAASRYVTSVGGTTLDQDGSETAWSGAGSGCSAYETRPTWQSSLSNGCARRAVADVSFDADPSTGVAVYDTLKVQGLSGWIKVGGTSVGSPAIAAIYGLAGNGSSVTYGSYPYSHTASLVDITSGSNGNCGSKLCTAATGWDGPTGLGTPNGIGAF